MESWRITWRNGFVPVLPRVGLEALYAAVTADDATLTQGSTTTPPPLMCVMDWPVEAADAVAFAGWKSLVAAGNLTPTVGQVEEAFARACYEADQRLGEPAACRWFLNFFDDTPRPLMLLQLRAELGFNLGLSPDPAGGPVPAWSAVTPSPSPF